MRSIHEFVQRRQSTAERPSAETIEKNGVTLYDALYSINVFLKSILEDFKLNYVTEGNISISRLWISESLSDIKSLIRENKNTGFYELKIENGKKTISKEVFGGDNFLITSLNDPIVISQHCTIEMQHCYKNVQLSLLLYVMPSQQYEGGYTVGIFVYDIKYVLGITRSIKAVNFYPQMERPIRAPPADGRPFLEYYQQKLNKYRENPLFSEAALLQDTVMQELIHLTLPEKNAKGELVSSLVWPISGSVSLRRSLQKISEELHGS